MEYRIEKITEKKLVGIHIKTTLSAPDSSDLWRQFMPRRKEIKSTLNPDIYSVEIFPANNITPTTIFDKWAAVEVKSFENIPEGFETLTIESGLYAVFEHAGNASTALSALEYIMKQWLPNSGYTYDQRAQFEIMPEGYNPNDLHAKEEFWIPIK